jgi:hypothetical protein
MVQTTTPTPRSHYPDIAELQDAFDACELDARRLLDGLSNTTGTWRRDESTWSVAQCLDHIATANRVYLQAMAGSSADALARGRTRRGPARPGLLGGWFARSLEPPAEGKKIGPKSRAPKKILPQPNPALKDAAASFSASQQEVRDYIARYEGFDLAGVRFPNPFVRGIRFSLATGLHVLAAHARRHLWQAWNVRREAEAAGK